MDRIAKNRWQVRLAALVIWLLGVAAGALARTYRLAAFALLWPLLAFGGLVLVYWISVVPVELTLTWTAPRIVVTLVVGAAALAPLLVAEAWRASTTSAETAEMRRTPASSGPTP